MSRSVTIRGISVVDERDTLSVSFVGLRAPIIAVIEAARGNHDADQREPRTRPEQNVERARLIAQETEQIVSQSAECGLRRVDVAEDANRLRGRLELDDCKKRRNGVSAYADA